MKRANKLFLVPAIFLFICFASSFSADAESPSDEIFKSPLKEFRPWVRWWWPGNDVAASELQRELDVMDSAGFGGAEIQAFTMGLNLKPPEPVMERVLSFGSQSYFEHVLAAVEEAEKLGMQIDVTLGSGWPFGGTHITKDLTLKTLLWNEVDVKGPRRLSLKTPPPKKPIFYTVARVTELAGVQIASYYKDDFKPFAAVAAKAVGDSEKSWKPWNLHDTVTLDFYSLVNLTSGLTEDGLLEWNVPEGKWKIIIFYVGPNGTSPTLLAEKEPGLTMDHFSRESLMVHINHVLEPGAHMLGPYYGGAFRGFFTDSLELKVEHCWTEDFLAEFEKRRGYDLTPYLAALPMPMKHNMVGHLGFNLAPEFDFQEGLGDRIRHDADLTLVELYSERFIEPMAEYAKARGLKSRVQAHGMQADILHNYGVSHIPETEQLYAGGNTDFLKMSSSAGHVYGRNLVTSESVVWDTRDYMTTPLKIKAAADKLFTAGINGMIFHGFPYTYKEPGFGTPAWAPFSSPFFAFGTFSSNFNEENPFFKYLPLLNGYITRCQYVLRQGVNVAQAATYYPLFGYPQRTLVQEELTGGLLDETDAPRNQGGIQNMTSRDTPPWPEHQWTVANVKFNDLLTSRGYNYDHVNERSLLGAYFKDGVIRIGHASYRLLVFNRIERLSVEAAEKVESLGKAGAPIVFVDCLPQGQPGFKDYESNDPVIRDKISRLVESRANVIYAESAKAVEKISAGLGILPDAGFDRPMPDLDYVHRRAGNTDIYFFRNSSRAALSVGVTFDRGAGHPEIWCPWTGEIRPAMDYSIENGRLSMDIELEPYGSLLVLLKPGRGSPGKPVAAGERETRTKDIKTWRLDTGLMRPDGSLKPISMEMESLSDWRDINDLKGCSSQGLYTASIYVEPELSGPGIRAVLDLGDVRDAAEVSVNGRKAAVLLVPPFTCDLTGLLEPGDNKIEVLVTPTLFNRLVRFGNSGDKRYRQFKNRKSLMPSGLIGPACLRFYEH